MDNFAQGDVGRWIAASPLSIIMQPTTLCPMDCTYCYLADRHLSRQMTRTTAEAVAASIPREWSRGGPLEIVWHGGEPLAIGPWRFAELLDPFELLRREGRVRHKVQTSAALISDVWCDVFERFAIGVGVSIDGPRHLNEHRVDRGGHPLFDRTLAGINSLRRRDISFTVLAVVPPDATGHAVELLDFIESLGCVWLGLNMEALEAANAHIGESPSKTQARTFWREVFSWALTHQDVHIRDLESLLRFLARDAEGRMRDSQHDLIPTIGWNGDTVVLSPELLGVRDEAYGNFVVRNVTSTPLPAILRDAAKARYVQEFAAGVARCQAECEFFAYCQGAHAGNRYFEHGAFAATETEHCKVSYQAPALALADLNTMESQK